MNSHYFENMNKSVDTAQTIVKEVSEFKKILDDYVIGIGKTMEGVMINYNKGAGQAAENQYEKFLDLIELSFKKEFTNVAIHMNGLKKLLYPILKKYGKQ